MSKKKAQSTGSKTFETMASGSSKSAAEEVKARQNREIPQEVMSTAGSYVPNRDFDASFAAELGLGMGSLGIREDNEQTVPHHRGNEAKLTQQVQSLTATVQVLTREIQAMKLVQAEMVNLIRTMAGNLNSVKEASETASKGLQAATKSLVDASSGLIEGKIEHHLSTYKSKASGSSVSSKTPITSTISKGVASSTAQVTLTPPVVQDVIKALKAIVSKKVEDPRTQQYIAMWISKLPLVNIKQTDQTKESLLAIIQLLEMGQSSHSIAALYHKGGKLN